MNRLAFQLECFRRSARTTSELITRVRETLSAA
jgi:hypothetical protein